MRGERKERQKEQKRGEYKSRNIKKRMKLSKKMGKIHCECFVDDTLKASADFLFYLSDPTQGENKE